MFIVLLEFHIIIIIHTSQVIITAIIDINQVFSKVNTKSI